MLSDWTRTLQQLPIPFNQLTCAILYGDGKPPRANAQPSAEWFYLRKDNNVQLWRLFAEDNTKMSDVFNKAISRPKEYGTLIRDETLDSRILTKLVRESQSFLKFIAIS